MSWRQRRRAAEDTQCAGTLRTLFTCAGPVIWIGPNATSDRSRFSSALPKSRAPTGPTRLWIRSGTAALALSATSCSHWPKDQTQLCDVTGFAPAITVSEDQLVSSTQLSVFIYNVEGLPWAARRNRGPSLDQIGAELAKMRQAGTAPDVVLVQEAVTPHSARIGTAASYSNRIRGPSRSEMPETGLADQAHVDGRRFRKGERSDKRLESDLDVFSTLARLANR